MKPGERVDVMKKVAATLSRMEPVEIGLTLRQFGFPTGRSWDDEPSYGFALRMLEEAENDDGLLGLHQHLHPSESATLPESGNWEAGRFRLFMSHTSGKKTLVAAVKAALTPYGVDAFVAHEDIEPTTEWVSAIEVALDTCHALAAFLTEGFHESKWTDQELGFCMKRRILILPIRVGVDPYGFISRYQALSPPATGTGQEKLAGLAESIVNTLVGHDLTSQNMSEALLAQFEHSRHFSEAKRNASLLDKVPRWNADQLSRLSAAATNNYENANAFGVPDRVRQIIEKHGR